MTDEAADEPQFDWWRRIPVIARAILTGIVVGLGAANVWPILLITFGMPTAAGAELAFFIVYLWWVSGGGAPKSQSAARADSFRVGALSRTQWIWGLIAAAGFAATVHASMVVLFRLVPFPADAFHMGYDFSFIDTEPMRWLAIVVSAASAGICEEVGFRGYMQRPIEKRHGALLAILISSLLFALAHLNKQWSLAGMVPIVFGAGLLLGTLAWTSRTLVFCMIAHTLMDIGLFAFWWTQIVGTFTQRPIFETGMDPSFYVECAVAALALLATLWAIVRVGRASAWAAN